MVEAVERNSDNRLYSVKTGLPQFNTDIESKVPRQNVKSSFPLLYPGTPERGAGGAGAPPAFQLGEQKLPL